MSRIAHFLCLSLLIIGILGAGCMRQVKEELSFSIQAEPYDADPLEFDFAIHHIAYGSTLSPLITNYTQGAHTGLLAESWTVSNDQKTWAFRIRSGMTFEDGSAITPDVIAQSLHRIACLQKGRDSQSGVIEHLDGIEKIAPGVGILGIQADQTTVTLRFRRAMPDLLDQLSFGLYAVVSPKDYDSKTLKWLAGAKPNASGPYRVTESGSKVTRLELRPEFPKTLLHPRAFKSIRLVWDSSKYVESDIFVAAEGEKTPEPYSFIPSGLGRIFYVSAFSAKDEKSPLHAVEARRWLRDKFYQSYRKSGFSPPNGFFPGFSTSGVNVPLKTEQAFGGEKTVRYSRLDPDGVKRIEALNQAFEDMAAESGLKALPVEVNAQRMRQELHASMKKGYSVDLVVRGTEIRIDSPDEDIRFMFRSKEGIQLPDFDGRIEAELKKDRLDIPKINGLLWEQAAVWPTLHPVTGYYVRESASIEMSRLNTSVAPVQLQWIGRK